MGLMKRLTVDENIDNNGHDTLTKAKEKKKQPEAKPDSKSLLVARNDYHELKEKIHRRLIEKLDLTKLDSIPREKLKTQVRDVIEILLQEETDITLDLNRDRLTEEILLVESRDKRDQA